MQGYVNRPIRRIINPGTNAGTIPNGQAHRQETERFIYGTPHPNIAEGGGNVGIFPQGENHVAEVSAPDDLVQQDIPPVVEKTTEQNYYNCNMASLPCCSMVQMNMSGNPTKAQIMGHIKNHSREEMGGRRVFMANVLIPGEEALEKALIETGFVMVAEFSRRHRYFQNVRIRMYLYEPESTASAVFVTDSEGNIANKIVLPNT